MNEALVVLYFFLFVAGCTGAALLLFRWRVKPLAEEPPIEARHGLRGELARGMFFLGEIAGKPRQKGQTERQRLTAAGYHAPAAVNVFHGIRTASAVFFGLCLGWVGLLDNESLTAALLLAVCGLGFGYLLPERVLDARIKQRNQRLERAIPNALDLMVLSVEAGQSLDTALFETGRELQPLYPDLAAEFAQAQYEMRAGRSRAEVLYSMGTRTGSQELKKLAVTLTDTDRFGTSLGPALRTHAKYLRLSRRNKAQESARKLSVKLIFPVFFLIMPAIFVITLGPAVLQFSEAMSKHLGR
jgi:tight adherence protein C